MSLDNIHRHKLLDLNNVIIICSYLTFTYFTNWLYSPLWALASCASSLQVTNFVQDSIHRLPFWDHICLLYPRPYCRFLNWVVLHDEVLSPMRNPYPQPL
jgi:hypothetical protein